VTVCEHDDEGDGVHDLEVMLTQLLYTDCTMEDLAYLVPAQALGYVELGMSPLARRGMCLDSVGDQDGDGTSDFDWGDVVYAGPATWVNGSPVSTELFTYDSNFWSRWTGIDFTGDGIDDWWGTRLVPELDADVPFTILSGGITGGITTGIPSWQIFSAVTPVTAYTEGSTNYIVFTDDFNAVRFVAIQ
jgi:hypothetical protein